MSSLSDKQMLSVVGLMVAAAVFLGALAWFADFNGTARSNSNAAAAARIDCIGKADFDSCADRAERQFAVGRYEPWQNAHPVMAALIAATIAFFVIAGGGRLLME